MLFGSAFDFVAQAIPCPEASPVARPNGLALSLRVPLLFGSAFDFVAQAIPCPESSPVASPNGLALSPTKGACALRFCF